MEIWLKNDDYNLRFPVMPSDYEINSESNNTSEDVNAIGEVTLLGKRKLKEISFTAEFPEEYNPTFCCIIPEYSPTEYQEIFEKMKEDGVCVLTMADMGYSGDVTIEAMPAGQRDGTGSIFIDFTFKEYRLPNVEKSAGETTKRVSKKSKACTYKTKKNDTLSKIAKKLTGSSKNWKTIYKDNKKKLKKAGITTGAKKMKAGIKLKIRAF